MMFANKINPVLICFVLFLCVCSAVAYDGINIIINNAYQHKSGSVILCEIDNYANNYKVIESNCYVFNCNQSGVYVLRAGDGAWVSGALTTNQRVFIAKPFLQHVKNVAVSPCGTKIAWLSEDKNKYIITTTDINGNNEKKFHSKYVIDYMSWSNDSSALAFYHSADKKIRSVNGYAICIARLLKNNLKIQQIVSCSTLCALSNERYDPLEWSHNDEYLLFQGKIENKCGYHFVNVNNGIIKSAIRGIWHESKDIILGTSIVDYGQDRKMVPVYWPIDGTPRFINDIKSLCPQIVSWKPDGKQFIYFDNETDCYMIYDVEIEKVVDKISFKPIYRIQWLTSFHPKSLTR